jgi:hypothetical protein
MNKPALWRKDVSVKINGEPVLLRSQDYVAQLQAESSVGQPLYYSSYDFSNWDFAPVPDQPYNLEIIYYSLVTPLSPTTQQNLFTAITPQLMLYGSLYHAMVYLKALDKIGVWKGYYDNALAAVKQQDASRRIDRNTTVQS